MTVGGRLLNSFPFPAFAAQLQARRRVVDPVHTRSRPIEHSRLVLVRQPHLCAHELRGVP